MVCTHSCHTQEGHRQDQNVCRPVSTKQVCQEREVPIHHPSPGRCQHRCRKRKTFTKLDAMKGYHQCPLDEASQLLTNSSYPSVGSNTSVCHMASPPFQSIVTTRWMKHSLDSLATAASLTMLSFTTATQHNTLTTSGSSCNGVLKGKSH